MPQHTATAKGNEELKGLNETKRRERDWRETRKERLKAAMKRRGGRIAPRSDTASRCSISKILNELIFSELRSVKTQSLILDRLLAKNSREERRVTRSWDGGSGWKEERRAAWGKVEAAMLWLLGKKASATLRQSLISALMHYDDAISTHYAIVYPFFITQAHSLFRRLCRAEITN